tara:strand:- start:9243 stop:13535 length:4293 start_codon:yes stop_codon:yes gene_type:complete
VLFGYVGSSYGQLVANFSANQNIGCAPLLVGFTDLSSGSTIIYRKWDFGNGRIVTGNNNVPSIIYNTPGAYSVTLTVSDGVDTVTINKSGFIQVASPPVPRISLPFNDGCVPVTITAVDSSLPSLAPIVSWEWDFNDGSLIDTNQVVSHTFSFVGDYYISLKVTDSLGCSNIASISQPFRAHKPVARLNQNGNLFGCLAPFNLNITNLSQGIQPLDSWWVVNNQTIHSSDLNTVISNSGKFDVFLKVEDSLGCFDSILIPDLVEVGNLVTTWNVPDTLCKNAPVDFMATAAGTSSFNWDFGDNTTGLGSTVSHTYTNGGWRTVELLSVNSTGCMDTLSKLVFIESVQAGFTSSPHYSCILPMAVAFQDNSSSNVVKWNWRFGGDAMGSTLKNPNISITTPGIYNDTLVVETAAGCKSAAVVVGNDSLLVTQAEFTASDTEGCAPLVVNFQNITNPMSSVNNVMWDFGVSPTTKSTSLSPSYTFQFPGIYFVKLTIFTKSGCQSTQVMKIRVGTPQTPNFYLDTNDACASYLVSCFNTSTNTSLINDVVWDFGDNNVSNAYQPQHHFQDTGYLDVTLSVGYNGCYASKTIDSAIYIKGPILGYTYQVNCDTPNQVSFVPYIIGGTDYQWNFGDKSALSFVGANQLHAYPAVRADYIAVFSGSDSVTGCTYHNSQTISIRYLQGDLVATDSIGCKGDLVTFSTSGSVDAFGFTDWAKDNWNTLNTLTDTAMFALDNKGVNTVYAVVHDVNQCADTMEVNVKAYQPLVDFGVDTTQGCAPVATQFTDQSVSDTLISSWSWDFGDGTNSNSTIVSHMYTAVGSQLYSVSLTVRDTLGCTNTRVKSDLITVNNPTAFFGVNYRTACTFDTIKYANVSTGNYTYLWHFGDGDSSQLAIPDHLYLNSGNYTTTLKIRDNLGCESSFSATHPIQIFATPDPLFVADTMISNCYPFSVVFTNTNSSSNTLSWEWDFGDGSTNVFTRNSSAQHMYTSPGAYFPKLKVSSLQGCQDSLVLAHFIDIKGPLANLNVVNDQGCTGQAVVFDVTGTNPAAQMLALDFGDGVVSTLSNLTNIKHSYTNPDDYFITLMVSDSLKKCVKTKQDQVTVKQLLAAFDFEAPSGCTPLDLVTINQSIGESGQFWFFDNLPQTPQYNFSSTVYVEGMHEVKLVVRNDSLNCTDTLRKQIEVFPLPKIGSTNDTVICAGDSVQLNAWGGENYIWTAEVSLQDVDVANPWVFTSDDQLFTVSGTDSNGCVNEATTFITLLHPPQLYYFPSDTMVHNGEEFRLSIDIDEGVDLLWESQSFLSCNTCPDPRVAPDQDARFTLFYTDTLGCFPSDTSFHISVTGFSVFIPNAFTPNGDGLNDVFIPITEGVDRLMYMYIYDPWGGLVFETTNLELGWDGTDVNGQIYDNGAFAYKLRVIGLDGKTGEFSGLVNLIK